jgi:hypothetical protein
VAESSFALGDQFGVGTRSELADQITALQLVLARICRGASAPPARVAILGCPEHVLKLAIGDDPTAPLWRDCPCVGLGCEDSPTTSLHQPDGCIFCGSSDLTEEHLIAAWVFRAFHRSRRHPAGFGGTFVGPGELHISPEEPIATAKVLCRRCNNEWISRIDTAAADVLKPLIRGEETVTLDRAGQVAFAAWIYKSALVFDAAIDDEDGDLASLRQGFHDSHEAGPGCVIYAGLAPPAPISLPGVPEVAGLRMFGVRPISGTMNLEINVQNPDGTVTPGRQTAIAIPGYQVMLGALCAYLGGRVPPITEDSLEGYVQVWPARSEPVTVSPFLPSAPDREEA